jgi:hypothetical protein
MVFLGCGVFVFVFVFGSLYEVDGERLGRVG